MEGLSLNDYTKDITDASFELLKKFLDLMNEKNIQTVVIGGWATEAFKKGIGSKDIDVVMQNEDDVQKLLSENFFDKESVELVEQIYPLRYKKTILVKGNQRTIICDIFSAEHPRTDFERLGIQIHWNLTYEFKERKTIRNIPAWVPKRELLIILKIIAAVDRSIRLDMKQFDDDENLASKIWKDYRDVAVLTVGQKLNKEFLKEHITKSHLLKYMDTFLSRYKQPENKKVLDDLSTDHTEMESALRM